MSDGSAITGGISLRHLLPSAQFLGTDDVQVRGCSGDSRVCRRGDLFVALPGTTADGHDHVCDAAQRGAAAVLVQRALPDCPVPQCVVPDTAQAYGLVCQALAGHPSQAVKLVGITGTNGKTTTSFLVAGVLQAGGATTGFLGTLGSFDGQDFDAPTLTTPTAPAIASWLAKVRGHGCSHAVMEVSSHALAQSRVAGLEFDLACVTNIRHDHLDYHGTWNEYRDAKARLFEHLSPTGVVVLNMDDPGAADLLPRVDGPALTVSLNGPAELTATPVEQFSSEQTFLLHLGSETAPVRTPLIGRHNISNCLVAAAVGVAYGIPLTTLVQGLESIDRVPGRLERIECGQPFNVFVDYAHTPDALESVLEALRAVTPGRVFCVFGAGGDRDPWKRPWMGRAVDRLADVAVITSDNPRHEDPAEIAQQVYSGFAGRRKCRTLLDRAEAIHWALAQAAPRDCVLIAGKGHEPYQQIGDDLLPFDDRQVVRDWLYENQAEHGHRRATA